MKVGLYFGSFNPIHTGHCIIATHIIANTILDQVWLVVSPQNPFKSSTTLLNEYHRLHLVQLAIAEEPGIKASDIEFHLPRPSYTVDTLTYVKEKFPQHDFAIIMGSDSFQNLPKWKNSAIIMREHDIYVYKRSGFAVIKTDKTNITLLDAPLLEISSTHIREYVKNKKSISFLVPEKVKTEIERNGYYR